MKQIYLTLVNGGEHSHVLHKDQSARRTTTVLDRASVAYILVVHTVQQDYFQIKVTNYGAIYTSSLISTILGLKKKRWV